MVVSDGNAESGTDSTRQILATVSGLQLGKHRAVVENAGETPIDIDAVVITDEIGTTG